jgi:hypothetical protein
VLRSAAEKQLKKRGGRKKYVDLYSQLIKAALASIEGRME